MPGDNNTDFEELVKLRDDLVKKISKLDEKKETTKEKIYLKVKSDYEKRLLELEEKIKENAAFVEERISTLKSTEEELKIERESFADKVEELKLRFDLGEFDDEEYKKVFEEEEKKLDDIDGRLGEVQKEINSISEFITDEKEGLEKAEEVAVEVSSEQEVEKESIEEVAEESVIEAEEEAKEVEEKAEGFVQEKKFEKEFVPAESAETQEKEIAESLEESIDDLLTESEGTEKTVEADEKPITPEIIPESEAVKEETSKLEGFVEDTGEMVVEKEEGIKTEEEETEGLKCPKCGFLNSKDSWYCEKCGAELLQ